jgi:hypothetical protein
MPISMDINLPKSLTPKFPDRCVACGTGQPGHTFRAGTNAIGWWTVVFWWFGARFQADVPACDVCRRQMVRQKWIRIVVNAVFIFVGVLIAMSLLQWYRGPFKKLLVMVVALICLIPLMLWETFFPKPFDMTAYSETVDYEFQNADYAAEFAVLNLQAERER